jgi:transcriptional regulator with XRE-family HTH domain
MAWLNGLPASVLLMWRRLALEGRFSSLLSVGGIGSGAIRAIGVSLAKGLSQTELADALGVAFQQVQKYEKGTNRVGSGRLLKISAILGVKITDFFEGTDRPHDTARALHIRSAGAARVVSTCPGFFRDRSPEYPPDTSSPDRQIAAEK